MVYRTIDGTELEAHVFRPAGPQPDGGWPAVVLFHGGGWTAGTPEWAYDTARRLAGDGFMAVSAAYRLSDQQNVTPLDAMADARAAVRFVRRNAARLGIDPERVAAGGISAGGHLATATAVLPHPEEDEVSAVPAALVIWSGAVDLERDNWFQRLLGDHATAASASPAANITAPIPPALLLVGGQDLITPPAGAEAFCAAARAVRSTCEIALYPGVGHLFTRTLDYRSQEQGPFDPDPEAVADAHRKAVTFLREQM